MLSYQLYPITLFYVTVVSTDKVRINHINSYFNIIVSLFCGFKNAQRQPCVCTLQKRCSSKCCKIYKKSLVPESIFNKNRLAALIKKTLAQVFSWEFFEIITYTFFIKHLRATTCECWRLEKSPRLLAEEILFQLFEVSYFDW